MENNYSSFSDMWRRKVTKIGVTMILITIVTMFGPVIYLKIAYGVFPEWGVAGAAWLTIAAAFGAYYIIEPLSYYPILGLSGTYMAFTAGSISDIRMPASAVAQEAVGVPYGSEEGSVISTIGVAGSLITSLIVVFLTAVFGTTLISFFPDWLTTALKLYTVPAVFGAVYVQFCKFEPKLSFLIIVTTALYGLYVLATNLTGSGNLYGPYMLLAVGVSVVVSRLLYKAGFLGGNDSEAQKE